MKVAICFLLLMIATAFSQETADMNLSEVEVLRGRVLGVEQGQLIERRATIIEKIQPQLDQIKELDAQIKKYEDRVKEIGVTILKVRGLDTAKYQVNWRESKIEENKK